MTSASANDLPLAAEFPAATREQWRKLVEGVLKGAPFDKRLVTKTYDGLAIEPLYGRDAQASPIAGREPGMPWSVMQRVDHPEPAAANSEALHDLENGATGLSLVFTGAAGAYGYGLAANEGTIMRALEGVHLDAGIALDLDHGAQAQDAARRLANLVKRRGISPGAVNIRFGLDPISAAAVDGASPRPWKALLSTLGAAVSDLADQGFRGPFAHADGRVIHNAGGSEAQELAYVLAVAVEYLRALEADGIALDVARAMIYFRLAADAEQLLTIAKFRALRKLWARLEAACGLEPAPPFVAAGTAWRMMTRRDPYVNMLRATIAVVGAGLGGADAITVLPFTMALGLPDRFARRIARNTQLVLLEESNLAKVAESRRRRRRHRGTDRTALPHCLDPVPGHRTGGRRERRPGAGPDPEQGRSSARRAPSRRGAAQGCAHRHKRFPRSGGNTGCGARRSARGAAARSRRGEV